MEKENIQPGSFRPAPEIHLTPETKTPKEIKAEPHPNLVAKYQLFDKVFNPYKRVVYHPCGAYDCSPSVVFPNSRVVYAELNEQAVKALQIEGFEAHHVSALEYDPSAVDVLIMLNPQISPAIPASYVIEGGHVVSNDYHGTASELIKYPDFQLRGLIRVTKDSGLIYDDDNPEDYWKEFDSEEEFVNAPFDWEAVNYITAARVVEALTGNRENVLAEYKKIIAFTREQRKQEYAKKLAEHPKWVDILRDPEKEDVLMLNHEGKQFILQTAMPRKKGTVDDLFIFERVAKLPHHGDCV